MLNVRIHPVVSALKICLCFAFLVPVATAGENTTSDSLENEPPSPHCPAFEKSEFHTTPKTTVTANPGNWIRLIDEASAGDEILLEDGTYKYESYAVVIDKPLTIRGKSKSPDNVIIQGRGYGDPAEGLVVMANDVQIADLTIQNIHHHAISIQETFSNTVVYNVRLFDIGTQHIKGNRPGPNGLIACSDIGNKNPIGKGDYNSGIDLHGVTEWTIRDNNIFNIFGDGSGCVVDTDCGTQHPGGGSGILVWQGASSNLIERNTITESYRGITLGLNTPYSGGTVRDNVIQRRLAGKQGVNGFIDADAGISLIGANNVLLEGNTVILAGDYPGAIEVWKSTGNTIKNNTISKPIWNRGDASFNDCQVASSREDCDTPEYGNVVDDNYLSLAGNGVLVSTDQLVSTAAQELADSSDQRSALSSDVSIAELQNNVVIDAVPLNEVTVDLLDKYKQLLQEIRQERLLMMSDLLKFKEERLLLKEDDLKRREADVTRREQAVSDALRGFQGENDGD